MNRTLALSASILLCLAAATAHAEEPRPLGLSLAWFGENVSHPGARLAVEYDAAHADGHALVVGAGLGFWAHRGRDTAAFFTGDLGYRHTFSRGFVVELFGHLGVVEDFLAGAAFTPGDAGFVPSGVVANTAFIGGGTLGLGWDFTAATGVPLALTLRLTALAETPVNQVALLHPATQLALTWKL